MSKRNQVFWNSGPSQYGTSGSRMFREGDLIILEVEDFDAEDNRRYDYRAEFSIYDYEKALKEFQERGKSSINSLNGRSSLYFGERGENWFELTFFSTPSPVADPGGRSISGVMSFHPCLEDLSLK